MARVESYPKRDARYVLKEHERTAKEYKNDVDKKRTPLNWNYGLGNDGANVVMQTIRKRCKTIMNNKKMQNSTNILCNWVITYPATHCEEKEWTKIKENGEEEVLHYNSPTDKAHCQKFFDEAYQFACNRYGKENVIAGYVHMDETTPHLDICFVPDAISRKTKERTVSSASLLTKSELRVFHRDLEAHMEKVFGEKEMILNGRTKGNYTVSEMKERKKEETEIKTKRRKIKSDTAALKKEREDIETLENAVSDEIEMVLKLKKDIEKRENEVDAILTMCKDWQYQLSEQEKDLAMKEVFVEQQRKENEELIEMGKKYKAILEEQRKKKFEERMKQTERLTSNISVNRQNSTSSQFGR